MFLNLFVKKKNEIFTLHKLGTFMKKYKIDGKVVNDLEKNVINRMNNIYSQ